jgi:hypothetical protein
LVCRSGKCVRPRQTRPRCGRDGDCPTDHFCEKGKCKKIQVPEF